MTFFKRRKTVEKITANKTERNEQLETLM